MIEEKSEQELIQVIEVMGDYDEVTEALRELEERKSDKLARIANKIIREQLGDAYLQATAFEILYEIDFNEALLLLKEKMNELCVEVIISVIDCLCEDSEVIDIETVKDIVEKLWQRCDRIESADTHLDEGVNEAIDWFKESYGPKLQKS